MTDQVIETGAEPVAEAAAEPTSLLGSVAPEAQAPAEPAGEAQAAAVSEPVGFDVIPEKYRVMEGDQMNYAASAEALAKAYAERAAFGDIPEVYSAPEGIEGNWDEIRELPAVKNFAEQAKALGMTDKQFGFALQHIGAAERDGRNYAITQSREEAEKTLREAWKEPDAFDANLRLASNAVQMLVPEDARNDFGAKYGNDPVILQLLARIGGEISEDPGVSNVNAVPSSEDVETLMRSEAYRDSNHPDHKLTHNKVRRYYEKQYGTDVAL